MIHVVDANYGRLDNSMCVCCGQSMIHVVDANYGRLDNSMCVLWTVDDTRSRRQLRTTRQLHVCRSARNAQRQLSPRRFVLRQEMVSFLQNVISLFSYTLRLIDIRQFLPRDAMPAGMLWLCVCVCHKSEFYENGST